MYNLILTWVGTSGHSKSTAILVADELRRASCNVHDSSTGRDTHCSGSNRHRPHSTRYQVQLHQETPALSVTQYTVYFNKLCDKPITIHFTNYYICYEDRTQGRDVFEDNIVEAKAKAKATKFWPRSVLEVEASPRGPPSLGFLPRDATQRAVMPRRLSVCPSLSNSTPYCRLLCACVRSIVFMVLSPLLINHTQNFNVLRPYLEAKAKAAHRRGRGQGQGHKILSSRCPRGRGQSSRTPSLTQGTLKIASMWMASSGIHANSCLL